MLLVDSLSHHETYNEIGDHVVLVEIQGQGLCVVTVILEGKLEEMTAQAAGEKVRIIMHTCNMQS